jgi:hypothetical protein
MSTDVDLSRPPAFLAGALEFDGEPVIGFRALTERADASAVVTVVGYQLVTERGIYEFGLDGICFRASALHMTY